MDGGRTHRGPQRDPPPVLKTEKPTGTYPLPAISIPPMEKLVKSVVYPTENYIFLKFF